MDVHKTSHMRLVEKAYKKDIETLLREMYTEQRMTMPKIAEEIGVSAAVVARWLKAYDIPRRKLAFI